MCRTNGANTQARSPISSQIKGREGVGHLTMRIGAALPSKLSPSAVKLIGDLASLAAGRQGQRSGSRVIRSLLKATLHQSRPAAYEAYRIFNRNYPIAEQEFHEELIGRAVDFGYLGWPQRIQQYVRDKDVLDVGCGTGIHSIGYAVVGVKSYTGMDPVIKLDRDRTKNIRKREWEPFGWTPRQICDHFSRIELFPGTFEDFDSDRTFDVAVLHNVTEHLLGIDQVLHDTAKRLRPDGLLIFNHHNFYCWNGHHQQPRTVDEVKPGDTTQKQYVDWAHIRFEAPDGHYFHRGLNRIKLDDLRDIVERDYNIETWDEVPSGKRIGGGRLTNEIVAQFPELTRRELAVHNVFCIARKKSQAPVN